MSEYRPERQGVFTILPNSNGNSARLRSAFRSAFYFDNPTAARISIIEKYESLMTDGKGFQDGAERDIDSAKAHWNLINYNDISYSNSPPINESFDAITDGGELGNPSSQWVPNVSSPYPKTDATGQTKMPEGYGTVPNNTPFSGTGSEFDPAASKAKTIGKALRPFGKLGTITTDS
jgi:hypothetical protein